MELLERMDERVRRDRRGNGRRIRRLRRHGLIRVWVDGLRVDQIRCAGRTSWVICPEGIRQRGSVPVPGVETEIGAVAVYEDRSVACGVEVVDTAARSVDELVPKNV